MKVAKTVVALSVCLALLCGCSFADIPGGTFDARQKAIAYEKTARESFSERKAEFEQIASFMAERQGVSIDYGGITLTFIQDKDRVHLSDTELGFSEEELEAVTQFFSGSDEDRLDMWRIASNGSEAEFQVFADGEVRIILIKSPNSRVSPKVMYPYFRVDELEDGWVMLFLDYSMSTEEISDLDVINGN